MTCNGCLLTPDCERVRLTGVAQPMNTASSLAYLTASLGTLIVARRTSGSMRINLNAYAAALAASGIGSAAYHGHRPGRTHYVHDGSVPVTFALALSLLTRIALNEGVRWRNPHLRRLLALSVLAAAAYRGGRTTSRLCHPDSPLQLHAAWHVLSALAGLAIAQAAAETANQRSGNSHTKRQDHRS
jgi:hypothetical protein